MGEGCFQGTRALCRCGWCLMKFRAMFAPFCGKANGLTVVLLLKLSIFFCSFWKHSRLFWIVQTNGLRVAVNENIWKLTVPAFTERILVAIVNYITLQSNLCWAGTVREWVGVLTKTYPGNVVSWRRKSCILRWLAEHSVFWIEIFIKMKLLSVYLIIHSDRWTQAVNNK